MQFCRDSTIFNTRDFVRFEEFDYDFIQNGESSSSSTYQILASATDFWRNEATLSHETLNFMKRNKTKLSLKSKRRQNTFNGATGFLGAHLLDSLLKHDPKSIITCLVRNEDECLSDYTNRIKTMIKGDLKQDKLGLNKIELFNNLT